MKTGGKSPDVSVRVVAAPRCPGCGTALDGAMAVDLSGVMPTPTPGDLTVCLYCAAPLEFVAGESALELRRLKPDALILALADPDFRRAVEIAREVREKLDRKRGESR